MHQICTKRVRGSNPLVSYAAELVKLAPELSQLIVGLTPSPPLEPDQERHHLKPNSRRISDYRLSSHLAS